MTCDSIELRNVVNMGCSAPSAPPERNPDFLKLKKLPDALISNFLDFIVLFIFTVGAIHIHVGKTANRLTFTGCPGKKLLYLNYTF